MTRHCLRLLVLLGCALPLLGGCAAGSRTAASAPRGFTFLSVDSSSYRQTTSTPARGPADSLCTRESVARPESPYVSVYECNQALAVHTREKGYLYRVRTPGDSLVYVLSRIPVTPGRAPMPDSLTPPPPEPGYERIRLGATYRDLDLRAVPVQIREPVTDPRINGGRPFTLIVTEQVSPEYAARYRPLMSHALLGPYVRVGHAVMPSR